MIRTLKITSLSLVILAGIIILLPAVFGFRKDEEIEKLLSSAGAVERFENQVGDRLGRNRDTESPLVSQARKFADYLNPPAVKTKRPKRTVRKPPAVRKSPAVSSKFQLIGTSFYALRPQQSLALIDQPGKGLCWVRQGGRVGHSTIEQIKDGLVIVKDGSGTYELTAQRTKRPSLITPAGAVKGVPGSGPQQTAKQAGSQTKMPAEPRAGDSDELALMQMLVAELKAMKNDSGQADTTIMDADAAKIDQFIAQLETQRVTDAEAQRLDELAKGLNGQDQEPNRVGGEPNQLGRQEPQKNLTGKVQKKTEDSNKIVRPRRTRRSRGGAESGRRPNR